MKIIGRNVFTIAPTTWIGWAALGIFFLVAISLVSYATFVEINEETPQTTESAIPDEYELYAQGQRYILQALKAPSTAEFPPLAFEVLDLGEMRYKVNSYVDSQNSFGAMVRTNWSVTMAIIGNKWVPEKIVVDGRVVYDITQAQ